MILPDREEGFYLIETFAGCGYHRRRRLNHPPI